MGQLFSLLLKPHVMTDIFMIKYLSRRGVTPYSLELIPGGEIRSRDDAAVRRHKFRAALKRQRLLDRALRELERREAGVTRCWSPCMVRDFGEVRQEIGQGGDEGQGGQVKDANGNVVEFKWRNDKLKQLRSRQSRHGFGNLDRLVVDSTSHDIGVDVSSEEVVAYDMIKNEKGGAGPKEPLRGSLKEKRARSRPEPKIRRSPVGTAPGGQRQKSLSVTQVMKEPEPHLLPPLMETPGTPAYVVVERIQLGSSKKSKKTWPSKETVRSTLKDPKTRPTSYFLARLRPTPSSDYVEIDYRFNKNTGKDSFKVTSGSLDNLLTGEALAAYQEDKANNNVNEKAVFFQNAPFFLNNCEGRIWWNGYIVSIDGPLSSRMHVKMLTMDPPAFIFDLSGLRHISATRNEFRLSFTGTNNDRGEGDEVKAGPSASGPVKKSFVIRGRTEQDVKQLDISHAEGTAFVSIILPILSGIPMPISTKSSTGKVASKPEGGVGGSKSLARMQ